MGREGRKRVEQYPYARTSSSTACSTPSKTRLPRSVDGEPILGRIFGRVRGGGEAPLRVEQRVPRPKASLTPT